MKRIGITMRSVFVPTHGETRDCLDSQLSALFIGAGFFPILLPAGTSSAMIEQFQLDGVVLSGGEDVHPQFENPRDQLEKYLIEWSLKNQKPLLGICRGMQMLCLHFGGKLEVVSGHVATTHSLSFPASQGQRGVVFPVEVNSFHNNAIRHAPADFEILALSPDGLVEAFVHKSNQLLGIMWHPERKGSGNNEFIFRFFERGQ